MICTCEIQSDIPAWAHYPGCALLGAPHFFSQREAKANSIKDGTDTRLQTLEREFWERCVLQAIALAASQDTPVSFEIRHDVARWADLITHEWRERFAKEEEPATIPWKKRIANEP